MVLAVHPRREGGSRTSSDATNPSRQCPRPVQHDTLLFPAVPPSLFVSKGSIICQISVRPLSVFSSYSCSRSLSACTKACKQPLPTPLPVIDGLFVFIPAFRGKPSDNRLDSSQGLSKPSDSSPPIAFPSSELDKLRDLPVWKTLSGKRVAVDRNRHFSLAAGGDVADLPLPPGASDR